LFGSGDGKKSMDNSSGVIFSKPTQEEGKEASNKSAVNPFLSIGKSNSDAQRKNSTEKKSSSGLFGLK